MSVKMEKYWKLEKGTKEYNLYRDMEKQIRKVFRHCRQNSIKSRHGYENRVKHFAKFAASIYNKRSLNNIQNKHLEAYVQQMQEVEYATTYISGNISAIKFFIDQIKDSSYVWDNRRLGVIPASEAERIGNNKAWKVGEIEKMKKLANEKGYERVADAIEVARNMGLRIHEVTRLSRLDLQKALKEGTLTIKGKGGLVRKVPICNEQTVNHFKQLIEKTQVGHKVFVTKSEKTHLVIKEIQNFINRTRDEVQIDKEGNRANISFHGIRHYWARERYQKLRSEGLNDYDARDKLSNELGHFRISVTNIYLQDM